MSVSIVSGTRSSEAIIDVSLNCLELTVLKIYSTILKGRQVSSFFFFCSLKYVEGCFITYIPSTYVDKLYKS